jgi:hypothetical protein
MGVLRRLRQDLRAGWATLRHGTARAASRALEEAELLRLRLELRKLDEQLADLHRELGERAVSLYDKGEPAERVVADAEVLRRVDQIRLLKNSRAKLLSEMEDVRRSEE